MGVVVVGEEAATGFADVAGRRIVAFPYEGMQTSETVVVGVEVVPTFAGAGSGIHMEGFARQLMIEPGWMIANAEHLVGFHAPR